VTSIRERRCLPPSTAFVLENCLVEPSVMLSDCGCSVNLFEYCLWTRYFQWLLFGVQLLNVRASVFVWTTNRVYDLTTCVSVWQGRWKGTNSEPLLFDGEYGVAKHSEPIEVQIEH
jgi:hypothetical protein